MLKLVVLSYVLAVAAASAPLYVPPLARFAAPIGYTLPLLQPYNYRGPLSLAPGQPADILGADGRPLDTLDVNLDRAAHFAAKTGLHLLKKRSAPLQSAGIAPLAIAYNAPIDYATHLATSPFSYAASLLQPYNYRGPLSLAPGQPAEVLGADGRPLDTLEVNLDRAAHIAAKTGLHLLKKRSAPIVAAPVARLAVAAAPLYSAPIATPLRYAAPFASIIRPITYAATPIIHAL